MKNILFMNEPHIFYFFGYHFIYGDGVYFCYISKIIIFCFINQIIWLLLLKHFISKTVKTTKNKYIYNI